MSETAPTKQSNDRLQQTTKYIVAIIVGAMVYDWADDQFDKNDEKPQWQFVEVNDILLMGNTRTGVLYEREAHTEGETYFRWSPIVSAPKTKKD